LLTVQVNLALTYGKLGHIEKSLSMEREVYSGYSKLLGEEDERTLRAASNYAASLFGLKRFKEAKSLLRKVIPMAQRALGKVAVTSLTLKKIHAAALCIDPSATHDDLREAVTTLEDAARTARRVFGGTHPVTMGIESNLQNSRAVLLFRETQPGR